MRRLCTSILRGAGHYVLEAEDGREAIGLYESSKPDVIVLDLRMPEMDGISTLQELTQRDAAHRVIIITAGTDAEIREAINLGARTVVLKPFSGTQLLTALGRDRSGDRPLPVQIYSWATTIDPSLYVSVG